MPRNTTLAAALWSIGLAAIAPAIAADVTPQRLVNASDEPQNWLMIHHDYDNSRHPALKKINRHTVKGLELKYTISIGGRSTPRIQRGNEESTPLLADSCMYRRLGWHQELDRRLRDQNRRARVAHLHDPGPGGSGLRNLEGQSQRLAHRRRQRLADRLLRSCHQPPLFRHRRRLPDLRS